MARTFNGSVRNRVLDNVYQGTSRARIQKMYRGGDLLFNRKTGRGERDTAKEFGFVFPDDLPYLLATTSSYVYIAPLIAGQGSRLIRCYNINTGARVSSRDINPVGRQVSSMGITGNNLYVLEIDSTANKNILSRYSLSSRSRTASLTLTDNTYTYTSDGSTVTRNIDRIEAVLPASSAVWIQHFNRLYELTTSLSKRSNMRRFQNFSDAIAISTNGNRIYRASGSYIEEFNYDASKNEYFSNRSRRFNHDDRAGGTPHQLHIQGSRLYSYRNYTTVWNCYRI